MQQFRVGNAFSISKTKYGGILFFFQTASTGKALALLHCRTLHHWYILPPCVLVSADLLPSHFPIGQPFPLGLGFFFYCAVIQKLYVSPVKTTKNNIKTTYFYMFFRHFFITLISPQYPHVSICRLALPCPASCRFSPALTGCLKPFQVLMLYILWQPFSPLCPAHKPHSIVYNPPSLCRLTA